MKNVVYLLDPTAPEGEVYLQQPIYIGNDLIKLDDTDQYYMSILEKKKIKSEDFEKLKSKNIKEFRSQLLQLIFQSFLVDLLYF